MAMICCNNVSKHFTQIYVVWYFRGGWKLSNLVKMGNFGHFGYTQICQTNNMNQGKMLKNVIGAYHGHVRNRLEKKMSAKMAEFPLYFSWISYIKEKMVAESRFWSNDPNFGFFLLRVHAVNELEGPIDDSIKKCIWAPP